VHLDHRDGAIQLRVENDPPPRPAAVPRARGGLGLTGMRERVGTVGGTLTIGPTAPGGFAVTATLPLDAAAAAERP
jgi:signal transduction histidine kinase